jgi:hypothetical protein
MCLKFREEITNLSALISLIDDDSGIAFELFCLFPTLKEKFVVFFILFFIF